MSLLRYTKTGIAVVSFFLSGCSSSTDPDPAVDPLDRVPMLTNWADNIIIPSYDKFNAKLATMTAKADAFAQTPNETTLADFRTSWKDAYIDWQKVELFEFGPGDRNTIRNFFNIYPADEAGIKQNISDPAANLALPVSYARQGFPALDYLINGLADSDPAILQLYTTDADASKRIAYIDKIVDRMNSLLTTVITDWKGSYRSTFIASTGLDIGSSTSNVVNSYSLNYERFIRSGKIGIPSGAMTTSGGVKYPEKVEAYYKRDISLTLAKTAHQATVDFFNGKGVLTGTEGPSLKSYLNALDAKDASTGTALSQIINNQFSATASKLDGLGENFYDQVVNNNQPMIDTYNELQKAVRMLKVDMTSAMSITITYTDNDGD
ncbi:MAG: imelysin family protein [Chryseolinea sp.]